MELVFINKKKNCIEAYENSNPNKGYEIPKEATTIAAR